MPRHGTVCARARIQHANLLAGKRRADAYLGPSPEGRDSGLVGRVGRQREIRTPRTVDREYRRSANVLCVVCRSPGMYLCVCVCCPARLSLFSSHTLRTALSVNTAHVFKRCLHGWLSRYINTKSQTLTSCSTPSHVKASTIIGG